jgi:riboflavin synthase alpha subunit
MDELQIQRLASDYADIIMTRKLGDIMAVRAYGACLTAGEKPSLRTIERFYDVVKDALDTEYRTVIRHMETCDQIELERAIARRVWRVIQDMLNGCIR